jgi:16S rRNA (cytidine1402-2'-O)-methyltransferase
VGKLILVGTPIGNSHDTSIRTFNYLKQAKNIVAENPEGFKQTLSMFGLDKSDANVMYAQTWPEYLGEQPILEDVLKLLESGENVYVVCDAGMPSISDPGGVIIKECIKKGIDVIATPGPSAVIAGAAITGCVNGFVYAGFIPKDKEQRKEFSKIYKHSPVPNLCFLVNMYDGRAVEDEYTVDILDGLIKDWGDRNGALCYNLTTSKEYVVFGKLSELKNHYIQNYGHNEVMIVIDSFSPTLVMPNGK